MNIAADRQKFMTVKKDRSLCVWTDGHTWVPIYYVITRLWPKKY